MLDGDDDDDSAAAANGQGPKGPRGGKGGAGGQGGKEGEDKPLSSGWKLALQNFGLKGGQTAEQKVRGASSAGWNRLSLTGCRSDRGRPQDKNPAWDDGV